MSPYQPVLRCQPCPHLSPLFIEEPLAKHLELNQTFFELSVPVENLPLTSCLCSPHSGVTTDPFLWGWGGSWGSCCCSKPGMSLEQAQGGQAEPALLWDCRRGSFS